MTAKKIYLGIDWGTHSSKWIADIITKNDKNIQASNLIKSDLLFFDEKIIVDPSDDYHPNRDRVISLKKNIIKDPYAPFWCERDDIGMSMGGGVTYSICALLGNFLYTIEKKKLLLDKSTDIEIGFSFPNWHDGSNKSKKAVNNYHQAIIVSCLLFYFFRQKLPVPVKQYPVEKWKRLINRTRTILNFPENNEIAIDDMTQKDYSLGDFFNEYNSIHFKWKFLVESCAAGLPYLRHIELGSPRGVPGLGKLLVVDVGAGSTDIGYMIRTISPTTDNEKLFYFPPAPTLDIAGITLTDEIKAYYKSMGKDISDSEAESFKITKSDEWHDKSFAKMWQKNISNRIMEYIQNSPDKHWLSLQVPLQIIITGGSGLVKGLPEEIEKAVSDGLKKRGVGHRIYENVKLIDKGLPNWDFSTKERYARMAVALGCADRDKPSLEYKRKADPPIRIETTTVRY